ncbi:MAG TPA: patatin-like phospholipase family protein [Alphaproteobacteria bacterium]|nr:patatin-like phospholipase family protein [Alphaproteobacteria bacterium]
MSSAPRNATRQPKADAVPTISLALQGGGAHGAFTWGVLDRMLEEVEAGRLRIAALSGTSAGAMNAAVCAFGLKNGPTAARTALGRFWAGMHNKALRLGNPYMWVPYNAGGKGWNFDDLPLTAALNAAAQVWSPYMSPLYENPLASVVNRVIEDFGVLNNPAGDVPKLYVAATNVCQGARKVFGPGEHRAEVLLASACLPQSAQAIEIDGAYYWDGGFTANPALEPLVAHADDMVIVQLNPRDRSGAPPRSAGDIADRVNEISFNIALVQEIQTIDLVNTFLRKLPPEQRHARIVNLHILSDDAVMADLGLASKYNLNWGFLKSLHDAGRAATEGFLAGCAANFGERSSTDIRREVVQKFLGTAR